MIKILLTFIALVNFSLLGAQTIDLDNLKTPDSPGFQILDISPTSIEKPINPKALGATLLSLTNKGSALPKNFAMEFSPYWYFKDKNASVHNYLNIEAKDNNGIERKNLFTGILNKLSVSLASVYSDTTSGSLMDKTNYLSFGVRTNLFTYRNASQNAKMKLALENYSNREVKLRAELTTTDTLESSKRLLKTKNKELAEMISIESNSTRKKTLTDQVAINVEQIVKLDAQIDKIRKLTPDKLLESIKNDATINTYLSELDAPPLIQLDGAFAYSEAFADNTTANRRFNRSGVWANLAINSAGASEEKKESNFTAIVLAKYINDNILVDAPNNIFERQNALDIGVRVNYSIKSFNISFEHLHRNYSDSAFDDSDRNVFLMQYKISDGCYLTGSYGKNFGEVNNLFTLFGLNYGFGDTPLNVKSN